jgi:hypothetical protein
VLQDGLINTLAEVQACLSTEEILEKWESMSKLRAISKIIETKSKSVKYSAFCR